MSDKKPDFILINRSDGRLVGFGSEEECRAQLSKTNDYRTYIIAEVKTVSTMQRVEE